MRIIFSAVIEKARIASILFVLILAGLYPEAKPQVMPEQGLRIIDLETGPDFYTAAAPHADYLVDEQGKLGADAVVARMADFRPVTTEYIDFGLTRSTIWLRMKILNNTGRSGPWRINFNRQYMHSIDAYMVSGASPPALVFRHRGSDTFSERPIQSTLLTQDISVPAGSSAILLIAFSSSATTFLPIGIGTPEAVVSKNGQSDTFNNLLNGVLWAMILLSLIMTPIAGWRISLSFAFYIAAGFFYVFNADGYTFRYFWPSAPWLNDRMNLTLMLLLASAGLFFVRQIFPLRNIAPKFDRWAKRLSLGAATLSVAAMFMIELRWFMIGAYSIVPVCAFMQGAAGVIAFRKGIAGAAPYLVGGSTVIISFAYATLAHIVVGRFDYDHTLDFGHATLVLESFVFAAAIVLRMLQIRRERDRAMMAELVLAKDQLELSRQLRQSEEIYFKVREAAKRKQEKILSVSHDLQQPLLSLRAGLAKLGSRDEASIQQMHAAFDYLESLARGQLEDAGQNEAVDGNTHALTIEEFDVSAVLNNVHAMFRREAESRGITFVYTPAACEVRTDPVSLMRAVSNLVVNAIKHSQGAELRLFAELAGSHVNVIVQDNGIGMDADMIAAALQPHLKGEGSDGSGLGLALVREVAGTLSIAFSVQSAPGAGARFVLSVPRADAA